MSAVFEISIRAPERRCDGHFKTGQRFAQVKQLMLERGGYVRASDLVKEFGMRSDVAACYLRQRMHDGMLTKLPAGSMPLKPGKWEPLYQLNLDFTNNTRS